MYRHYRPRPVSFVSAACIAAAVILFTPAQPSAQAARTDASTSARAASVTPATDEKGPKTADAPAKADPAGTGQSQIVPPKPSGAQPKPKPSALSRWFELQTGTIAARYRGIENSKGVQTADQLQDSGQFKGRFKFDPKGLLTVNAAYATGSSFTGGWNNTGVGTGDRFTHWYLKQLFAAYTPLKGVELTYGSMGFVRGEGTEITTFDNDGYMVGERVAIRRPAQFYLDEFGISNGYVGDLTTPSVTDRWNRMVGDRNYVQVFASKKLTKTMTASGDYARLSGVPYWHAAVTAKTPKVRVMDTVKFEYYSRYGAKPGTGFAVYGEKAMLKRVSVGLGYADIDVNTLPLNADRFFRGKRFYETASVKVFRDLTVQLFCTQAVANSVTIANNRRLDIVANYNVLGALQGIGWFR